MSARATCWPASARRGVAVWMVTLVSLAGMLVSACGASPATETVLPARGTQDARIVVRAATSQTTESGEQRITQSASCRAGEQLVGGGFSTSDVFESAVFALEDYPSAPNTWTVTASSISHFTLAAEAYCVPAAPVLAMRSVSATISGAGSVACPAGTVLLGGGFSGGTKPADASRPTQNGWYAAVDGAGAQVYALCAGQRASAGSLATATFNSHSSSNGQQPVGQHARCGAGEAATGGGFSGGGLVIGSQRDAPEGAGWVVEGGGDGAITIYAVCIHIGA